MVLTTVCEVNTISDEEKRADFEVIWSILLHELNMWEVQKDMPGHRRPYLELSSDDVPSNLAPLSIPYPFWETLPRGGSSVRDPVRKDALDEKDYEYVGLSRLSFDLVIRREDKQEKRIFYGTENTNDHLLHVSTSCVLFSQVCTLSVSFLTMDSGGERKKR